MDLALKRPRENLRKNIARELNCDDASSIDSDDERKWVSKVFEGIKA
jgi:hypothetical protein